MIVICQLINDSLYCFVEKYEPAKKLFETLSNDVAMRE